MIYTVYRASFLLTGGQRCNYVGYTGGSLAGREASALVRRPAWMKCMQVSTLKYTALEEHISTKAAALGWEAIHAARDVLRDSAANRGGPWLRPTLPSDWMEVASKVAKCRSLPSLSAIKDPSGRLEKHLKGHAFVVDPNVDRTAPRGAQAISTRSRSGAAGHEVL